MASTKAQRARVNRGFVIGQLVSGIELARKALADANRGRVFLREPERSVLDDITAKLQGLEQCAWRALDREAGK